MTDLGTTLLRAIALGLGLEPDWFDRTSPPTRPCCSASSAIRRGRRGVGRRRAHRLRTAHRPRHGPQRWVAGPRTGRVARRAAGSERVRRQPRRHARPDDRRSLSVDAAPGPQTGGTSACRSRASSTRRGTPSARCCRSTAVRPPTTPTAAGTAPASGHGTGRTGTTSRPRWRRCSPTCSGRLWKRQT